MGHAIMWSHVIFLLGTWFTGKFLTKDDVGAVPYEASVTWCGTYFIIILGILESMYF